MNNARRWPGEVDRMAMFLAKALVIHATLAMIAAGTVEGLLKTDRFIGIATILYYAATVVLTQFPSWVFFSQSLQRDQDTRPYSRAELGVRILLFWLFILAVLSIQIVFGMETNTPLERAFARWALLLGLITLFSASDFAVPSYQRHLRLVKDGRWGPRGRVFIPRPLGPH